MTCILNKTRDLKLDQWIQPCHFPLHIKTRARALTYVPHRSPTTTPQALAEGEKLAFNALSTVEKRDLQGFVLRAVRRMLKQNQPDVETLKLQVRQANLI